MTRLAGAHIVVTGGSSGIGLATARLARERGARISIVARDAERLAAAASEIGGDAPVCTAAADVTDADAVRRAIAAAVGVHGPVDVLMTSAGFAHPGHFEALDDAVFRDQMEVDYFGTLHAVRAVVPSMIERRRGHLVLISSTVGLVGVYGYSAYAPAKFAVRGLAEVLRGELRPHGIRVGCVFPPDTVTPGFDRENELKPAATARISASITPRPADHVAQAVVKGIEHDRRIITADVQTAALARAAGLLGPYVRWHTDHHVRRTGADD